MKEKEIELHKLNNHKLKSIANWIEKSLVNWLQWLHQIRNLAVNALVKQDEPRIYVISTQSGRTYWKIHDPVTNRLIYLDSEQDVRVWLDQQFYKR